MVTDILMLWLMCVLAFAAGVVVMAVVVTLAIKPVTPDQAIEDALAKEGRAHA